MTQPNIQADSTHGRSPLLQGYYPALDGLRALAFLSVFLDHFVSLISPWRVFPWGWVGVELFFVLSGFLITGILYDSLHREDYFKRFYTRRALRIFPLYYVFWLTLLFFTPVVHFTWNRSNLSSLVYLQNFLIPGAAMGMYPQPGHVDFLLRGLSKIPHRVFIETTPLWSLCVEEHFYLLWPLIVYLLRTRKALITFCLVAIPLFSVGRALYIEFGHKALSTNVLYVNSLSRFDSLLIGALLALWLRGDCPAPAVLRRYAAGVVVACPAILALLLQTEKGNVGDGHADPIVSTVGFSLIALASAGVLLLATEKSSPLVYLLTRRPLSALGRISYGMYFFHGLFLPAAIRLAPALLERHLAFVLPIGAFAFTLLLASLTFRLIESPFLRLKDTLALTRGPISDPKPV